MQEVLHDNKRALKHQLRAWELAFEEQNGGLVATHADKKRDLSYSQIKAEAKHVERALEACRRVSCKSIAGSHASTAGVAGTLHRLHPAGDSAVALMRLPCHNLSGDMEQPLGARRDFAFDGGYISLSPFHVLLLLLACFIPYAAFISAFSLMGFGAMVYDYLVSNGKFFYPLTLSATGLLVTLYLFDVSYWEHPLAVVARRILLSVAGASVLLGACLASREYPYAALLLLIFLAPGYWWLLQRKFLSNWPLSDFLRALSLALVLLSATAAGLWVGWVMNGNNWDLENKRRCATPLRAPVSPLSSRQQMNTFVTPQVHAADALLRGSHKPPSNDVKRRLRLR